MNCFRKGPLRVLGRFIGFAAAYALLLNLILLGLLGAQNAAASPHSGGIFELCQGSGDGLPRLPGDNSEHAGKVHCVLCVAGNMLADTATPSTVVAVAFETSHITVKPGHADLGLSSVDHRGTSPRGPPQRA